MRSCKQCMACRKNFARDWAIRCSHEASLYPYNYFVTVTYSDEFLHRGTFLKDLRTGEIFDANLSKKDASDFVKNVRTNLYRRYNGFTGLRTFYSGEYGDLYNRPHYHFLMFNCPDLSSEFNFLKRQGSFDMFASETFSDSWQFNPTRKKNAGISKGFVTVQELTFDTCAYTARYVTKKLNGGAVTLPEGDSLPDGFEMLQQPFAEMSRRPGIGADYYRLHPEIHDTDLTYYQKAYETYSSRPPRYYDKLYDIDHGGFTDRWTEYTDAKGQLVDPDELEQIGIDPCILDQKEKTHVVHSPDFNDLSDRRSVGRVNSFRNDLLTFHDLEERRSQEAELDRIKERRYTKYL